MEITSQQYLNTSRGVETSRPASVNITTTKSSNSSDATTSEEVTPAQKREQQQYEQAIAKQLLQLQTRDREVRAHEAAHAAVGGKYVTGGPSFTYQRGPNGRFYAIGGEVQIDVSPAADPEATLDKAETVRRAALAPAQPSPQDIQVASSATKLASRARVEIAIQQREQQQTQAAEKSNQNAEENNVTEAEEISVETASGYASGSLAEPARDVFDIIA